MKLTAILLLLFVINLKAFAQDGKTTPPRHITLGIVTGYNFTTFEEAGIDFEMGSRPFVGLNLTNHKKRKLNFTGSVLVSAKSSIQTTPNFYKPLNLYLELNGCAQVSIIDPICINAGLSFGALTNQMRVTNSQLKWFGYEYDGNSGYQSELNIITGLEMCFTPNSRILFNYNIPITKAKHRNFQIGFKILLNNRIPRKSKKVECRKKAEAEIKQLHAGILLVRLKTSNNKIKALKQVGLLERASEVANKQVIINKKIVQAFNNYFTFCPVVFFNDTSSRRVLAKDYSNIFLNDNLEIDTSIHINKEQAIFTAEFDMITQDTTTHLSHYSWNRNTKKIDANYYTSSSDDDFMALIIKDENFIQLNRPFRFQVRAAFISVDEHPEELLIIAPLFLLGLKTNYNKTVEKMNRNLFNYHDHALYLQLRQEDDY